MARYTDAVCRLCRREGVKLFLKGERCLSEKCAVDKRSYAPGQHGQRLRKLSEYGLALREKQKLKRICGLLEQQFHNYLKRAERQKGVTGDNLLKLIELRLDSLVHRCGFASSRGQARQLVLHRHILVNGKKVNIPSQLIRVNQVIEVREASRGLESIQSAVRRTEKKGVPPWLEVDHKHMRACLRALPNREEIALPVKEQLIVALYSK